MIAGYGLALEAFCQACPDRNWILGKVGTGLASHKSYLARVIARTVAPQGQRGRVAYSLHRGGRRWGSRLRRFSLFRNVRNAGTISPTANDVCESLRRRHSLHLQKMMFSPSRHDPNPLARRQMA